MNYNIKFGQSLALLGTLTVLSSAHAQQKPNILLILCDDLGYNDLGCYGSKLNCTPNIDRLAKEGIRFTDCYAAANVYLRGNEIEVKEVDQTQLTKTYTKEAIRFLTENRNRPFFLYLAHNMPHVPIFASEQFKGKSNNGLYGDVIEELDWSMGEILNKLRELKLDRNTLVVFSSDNGPWLTQGPNGGSALPLFQGKTTPWEGGHRVPLIAWWQGKIKAGEYSGLATLMDWFPTFANLVQSKESDMPTMDGRDLTDVLLKSQQRKAEDYFFFEGAKISAFRSGDYKMMLPHALRKGNRFVADVSAHDTLLFNLRKDIGEAASQAKGNPGKVQEMAIKLDEFKRSISGLKGKPGEPRPADWPR
jgi:arylsulfatase